MDCRECMYKEIIPYMNGNEYAEAYRCAVNGMGCEFGKCKLTEGEAKRLFDERMKENVRRDIARD